MGWFKRSVLCFKGGLLRRRVTPCILLVIPLALPLWNIRFSQRMTTENGLIIIADYSCHSLQRKVGHRTISILIIFWPHLVEEGICWGLAELWQKWRKKCEWDAPHVMMYCSKMITFGFILKILSISYWHLLLKNSSASCFSEMTTHPEPFRSSSF